ncbi:MAG: thioredoxin domain-containing protein [Acidobacteria bacterium]|nr:thioredoxin domain-containing protein [Acidobacteriota bacterium]
MSSLARRLILLFALAGLVAATASTYVHYRLLHESGYLSFCDISSTVNCTQAYLSRFGSFRGVPVAVLGALWFVLVSILAAASGRGPQSFRETVPGYLFVLATLALAAVLYLAYASLVILKTVCILCLVTYAAVAGIFLISGAATSFPMTTLPRRTFRDLRTLASSRVALVVALVFVLGSFAAIALVPWHGRAIAAAPGQAAAKSDNTSGFEQWYASQERVKVPVSDEGAKVVIVKFNDYQCPPCRLTYMQYQPILADFRAKAPGQIKFVAKDFPLDPECNVNAPSGRHQAACEAAVAVRLAHAKGKGEPLESWLFANQETLTPAGVRQAAREIGGVDSFDADYARTLEQVKTDIALASLLGVRATPTFFINGVRIQGGLQPEFFEAAIAYELKKAGK